MKQNSLSYRIFSASILYFIGTLFIFSLYRLYNEEYLVLIVYVLGMGIGGYVYRLLKKGKHLNFIVMPSLLLSLVFGAFFWFKDGGTSGSGLIFFTFILIATIVSPKKYSKLMLGVVLVIQSLLIWADIYLQDLPIWGESPNVTAMYAMGVLVNLTLVWMLKYNHDQKEEKIELFSQGLRELHRLNLRHDSNLDEILTDYLNSGTDLLGMQAGMIVEVNNGTLTIRSINESPDSARFSVELLSLNEGILLEVFEKEKTIYGAKNNSNLAKPTGTSSNYFIASPILVNNEKYGVLLFSAQEAKQKRFEEYDIEIMELMAINISHLLDMQAWSEHQKKTDLELHLSEKRFKTIYDYANVGICVCDRKGMVLMANQALQDLLEYSEAELLGETFYSISGTDDLTEMDMDIKQYEQIILGQIDHYTIEKKNTTKSGREIFINKTVSTVRDEEDKVRFTVMIVDDVTSRKLNENKIQSLNQQLEVQVDKMEITNKELEAFSYSVSHDLRAPLRAIDGFSKIILEDHEDEFSEESKRLLNVIIKNSGKMAMLIDDLLAFSRISRKVTEFKPIDFDELVKGIIEEQALDSSMFEISRLPQAKGEPTLMKQVFSNLIGNAVKFSSNESHPIIEIGVEEKGQFFEFFVKDNGVGFNMAYYDKVFGVFQRLHTDEEFKGTGVGLAIVQKVMMKHNGKVWAESEEGVGTTFYFSLPK
ncbi:ATP-binding protein [Reichenbachiella sp.]|uniref:ATP-binding protein n=1 Tax=Reichenbachiella sp. TaxID=2184521 RepID=UPI003BAF812A